MAARAASSESFRFTARDGLRLHAVRDRGDKRALPVLCLAGLTRNGRDFDALADALSSGARRTRDVWRLDYRGRGLSDHDRDWRNYTPFVEMIDVLDFMTAMDLDKAVLVATSRGGIIAMLMAAFRPTVLAAVVLNDIGPVLEPAGLARIAGYVGKTPLPATWENAGETMKRINGQLFPDVTDDEWIVLARQWYGEKNGRPAPGYDPNLARSFSGGRAAPSFWRQFRALASVPVLVVRGENSDLLTAATVSEMEAQHPRLRSFTVPHEGHAPLLRDTLSLDAIRQFLDDADPAREPEMARAHKEPSRKRKRTRSRARK